MAVVRAMARSEKVSVDDTAIKESLRDLEYALSQQQFDVAKATLRVILTAMPGIKSKNVAFLNALTSMREAVDTKEMTPREFSTELKSEFVAYRLSVLAMIEEVNTPSQKDELSLHDALDKSGNALSKYEKSRDQIEKAILDTGFVVTYAPVMPISTPILDVARLTSNGFKSETFAGYPILHNQFVVGVSMDRIFQEVDEMLGTELKKVGKTPTEDQRQAVYDNILDSVKSRFPSQRLRPVGAPYHWYNAVWFWMLPESHYKLLKSCTISATTVESLNLKKWSFPFRGK
jgi:hypothetical protein